MKNKKLAKNWLLRQLASSLRWQYATRTVATKKELCNLISGKKSQQQIQICNSTNLFFKIISGLSFS